METENLSWWTNAIAGIPLTLEENTFTTCFALLESPALLAIGFS